MNREKEVQTMIVLLLELYVKPWRLVLNISIRVLYYGVEAEELMTPNQYYLYSVVYLYLIKIRCTRENSENSGVSMGCALRLRRLSLELGRQVLI